MFLLWQRFEVNVQQSGSITHHHSITEIREVRYKNSVSDALIRFPSTTISPLFREIHGFDVSTL